MNPASQPAGGWRRGIGRQPRPWPSAPWRLLLALALLGPLAAYLWVSVRDRQAILRDAETAAIQTVDILHEHALKVFETHELVLQRLLEQIEGMPWEEIGRSSEVHRFLEDLRNRYEQIDNLWLNGPSGKAWNSSAFFPVPDVNIADRDYFQALASGAPIYVSATYPGRLTGISAFNVAMRREDASGAFDGVAVVSAQTGYFSEFYDTIQAGTDRIIKLVRLDGDVLVQSPAVAEQTRLSALAMRAAAQSDRGTFLEISPSDSRLRIFAFRKLRDFPVITMFGIAQDAVLAEWRRNLLLNGFFAAAAALALSSITWAAFRRVQGDADRQRAEILESITDAFCALDANWRFTYANRHALKLWDKTADQVIGRPYLTIFPQAVGGEAFAALTRVMQTRRAEHLETVSVILHRWVAIGIYPTADGGASIYFRDIQERKAAEERLKLLAREVDHRAKNMLSVVQAVLNLTRSDTVSGFRDAVAGRLAALGRVHSLLARSRWAGADLRGLIEEETAPFQTADGARVRVGGPAVALGASTAQSIAMVLHELLTNAAKYGALSAPGGSLAICWTVEEGRVCLRWIERGGPGAAPAHRGFGGEMIEAAVGMQLGGTVRYDWRVEGLTCEIAFPTGRVDWPPAWGLPPGVAFSRLRSPPAPKEQSDRSVW